MLTAENVQILLVDSLHGIYCLDQLVENFPLFNSKGEELNPADFYDTEEGETSWDAFDYFEPHVKNDKKELWPVIPIEGDLWAIHPEAEYSESFEFYFVREDTDLEYDLPTWALPALVNGDYSGLSEEDTHSLNTFIELNKTSSVVQGIFTSIETGYFSHSPEFGKACVVEEVVARPICPTCGNLNLEPSARPNPICLNCEGE